jgi:hypothetical protein
MLGRRRSAKGSAGDTLRPMLYGDRPLDELVASVEGADTEPWSEFLRVRDAFVEGRRDDGIATLRSIASAPGVESRVALQAWTFLRANGVLPEPPLDRQVLGVVVELPIDGSHDVMATYADGTARYLNHGGNAILVEGVQQGDLRVVISANIELGQQLADVVGLWDQARLPVVPEGSARVLLLTPGGMRFGQGPLEQLQADPMAKEIIRAAMLTASMLIRQGR